MHAFLLATILVVTDPHELAPTLHDNGPAFVKYAATAGGRDLVGSTDLWDAFLEKVLADPPQAVLITGDLTNQGERASHEWLAARLGRLKARGIPTLVIPGNHDINNPLARGFEGSLQTKVDWLGPDEFARLYRDFGYGGALSRDSASLSYLARLTPELWVLMLDSTHFENNLITGRPALGGGLREPTRQWIRASASRARQQGVRLIAAAHHSVADHSPVIRSGYTIDDDEAVAELLAEAGVELVLTGHIHIQDISSRSTARGPLFDVATNALSVYPNQHGRLVFDARAGTLAYSTHRVAPDDGALSLHAREAFRNSNARLFSGAGAALLTTLNENYFAGREDLNAGLGDTQGFRDLAAAEGFRGAYVQSLLRDFDELNDNTLLLTFR